MRVVGYTWARIILRHIYALFYLPVYHKNPIITRLKAGDVSMNPEEIRVHNMMMIRVSAVKSVGELICLVLDEGDTTLVKELKENMNFYKAYFKDEYRTPEVSLLHEIRDMLAENRQNDGGGQ